MNYDICRYARIEGLHKKPTIIQNEDFVVQQGMKLPQT